MPRNFNSLLHENLGEILYIPISFFTYSICVEMVISLLNTIQFNYNTRHSILELTSLS